MKKQIILCLLALCLLLTGCAVQQTDPEPTQKDSPSTGTLPMDDAQNKYIGPFSTSSFQEGDGFFIGNDMASKFLHYYDQESGVSGVLCADPSCTHDSPSCAAYVGGSGASMSYYAGKLYRVAEDSAGGSDLYLWRSDLSGSNQEQVKRLSYSDFIMVYQPQQYAIHRGYLYALGCAPEVVGTEVSYRITVVSSPLDSSEEFTAVLEKTVSSGAQQAVRFVGDEIYLLVLAFPEDGVSDITIMKYNCATGVSETVFEEADTEAGVDFWVTDQGDIYLSGVGENGGTVWKLEDGKRVEVFAWPGENKYPRLFDGVAVWYYKEDGILYMDIKTLSGEPVYSGKTYPEEIPEVEGDPNNDYGWSIVGGDRDKLIMSISKMGGSKGYTLLLDLNDNLKATVLWASE